MNAAINCENAQDIIREALDAGRLAEAPALVRDHLAACPECRAAWEELVAIETALRAGPPAESIADEPSPRLRQRVLAALDAEPAYSLATARTSERERSGFASWGGWGFAAAASLLAILAVAGLRSDPRVAAPSPSGRTPKPTPALAVEAAPIATEETILPAPPSDSWFLALPPHLLQAMRQRVALPATPRVSSQTAAQALDWPNQALRDASRRASNFVADALPKPPALNDLLPRMADASLLHSAGEALDAAKTEAASLAESVLSSACAAADLLGAPAKLLD
jgi:hypothetical protein